LPGLFIAAIVGDDMRNPTALSLALCAVFANAPAALASVVEAAVLDAKGKPVEGAVVFALDSKTRPPESERKTMDMKGMAFAPGFIAVTVGDSVSFPNKDTTHHHVYSFSKTKKFDSRLYKDGEPKTVVFDKPGLVKVGCKIHDWMKGTVLVTPSSERALTGKDGKASLRVSADGSVRVGVYHPRLRGKHTKHEKTVTLEKGKGSVEWSLKLKRKKKKTGRKKKVYY
jgi:plastocyanin